MIEEKAGLLAYVVRGDVVESVHLGHAVAIGRALDGAGDRFHVGDPAVTFFARSALKPLQAVAMLRAGLDLDGAALALACASHGGEPAHLDGVRAILAGAGLGEADLGNTPSPPWDAEAAFAWRTAGRAPSSLTQNCSGKHAAMLATCVANGWDRATYLDPAHPLQRAIAATVAELSGDGDPLHVTVDGCGAPLFSGTVAGLARAFAAIATAAPGSAEHRVATAMREHPWLVAGTGRFSVALVGAVPGLVAKEGADGVFAAALPDGRSVAFKVLDGGSRPVPVVTVALLRAVGVDVAALDEVGRVLVLGHGEPVGEVVPGW